MRIRILATATLLLAVVLSFLSPLTSWGDQPGATIPDVGGQLYLPVMRFDATRTPTLTMTPRATATQTSTPTPTVTPKATGTATKMPTVTPTVTRPAQNCDPSYPTVCIPSPPPDLDCPDIIFRNFLVLPPDPHHFDGDHDGVGCEN